MPGFWIAEEKGWTQTKLIPLTMCSIWNTFLWCWSGQQLTRHVVRIHMRIRRVTAQSTIIAVMDTKEILIFPRDVKVSFKYEQLTCLIEFNSRSKGVISLYITSLLRSTYYVHGAPSIYNMYISFFLFLILFYVFSLLNSDKK
jgi:hypothetical protein